MSALDAMLRLVPRSLRARVRQKLADVKESARQDTERLVGELASSVGQKFAEIEESARQDTERLAGVVASLVPETPFLAAKLYPYEGNRSTYLIPKTNRDEVTMAEPGLPLPPPGLFWFGPNTTAEHFLSSGREHAEQMRAILGKSGFSFRDGARVLDFGCASGRMIRWLNDLSASCEIWGVDINAHQLRWCQQYLTPPFRFAAVTTSPHLPFEDRYFDLVYAGSVFTHIADLPDAWVLELRRILRPGGRLFLSVFDNHCVDSLLAWGKDPNHWAYWLGTMVVSFEEQVHFQNSGFDMFCINRAPHSAQVFYDRDYLRRIWGGYFKSCSLHDGGYGFHTVIQLEK